MHTGKSKKKKKRYIYGEAQRQLFVVCFRPFCYLTFSSPAEGSYGEEKLVSLLMLQY